MKTFAEYLSSGIVRKQKANPERAKSLLAEAEKKRAFMIKVIENFSLRETEPNFVVESCYDILIELMVITPRVRMKLKYPIWAFFHFPMQKLYLWMNYGISATG